MPSTRSGTIRAIIIVALVFSFSLAACGSAAVRSAQTKLSSNSSVTVSLDEPTSNFNPNVQAGNDESVQEVLNLVWPQPFIVTPSNAFEADPDYLQSASVVSVNPETVVYQINPHAVWADGVPLTAADFIFNWTALSGKGTDTDGAPDQSLSISGYENIRSVTGSGPGDKTVTVVFDRTVPWDDFFIDLIPAHVAERVSWNNGFKSWRNILSGGPYEFQSYVPGNSMVLVRNPRWWGAKPKLSSIKFRFVTNDSLGPSSLRSGVIDVFFPATANAAIVAQTRSIPHVTVSVLPGVAFEHLDFNEGNFYLAELPVRQAIAYGTDRNAIIDDTVGKFAPDTTPLGDRMFLPTSQYYQNDGSSYDTMNRSKADQLLRSAGMSMGADGYFHPSSGPLLGQDLTFTISSTIGQPVRLTTEQIFSSEMKAIGVRILVRNYTPSTLFGNILPDGEFDIAEFAWVENPEARSNESLYCSYRLATCSLNYARFSDPEVDTLLGQAVGDLNPASAAKLYNDIDRILWAEMDTLPLYQTPAVVAWRDDVSGVIPNVSGQGVTWNA